MGTNILVGQDPRLLDSELTRILEGGAKKGSIPPLWDGRASERIVQSLRANILPESTGSMAQGENEESERRTTEV